MKSLKNRMQSEILCAIGQEEYFENTCEKFYFSGFDGRNRYSLVCRCKFDETANLIVTVPTVTRNIYITISDGDHKLVRQVMANLEDAELDGDVKLGNVMLLDDPALRRNSICGVILLPPFLFGALDHLPEKLVVGHAEHEFIGVVFITDKEHEIWKAKGHDALMDFYTESEKDLVVFGNQSSMPSST